jgi:hypothetical protein
MSEFHDSLLESLLIEGPITQAEIIQHGVASRVHSLLSELDDLVRLSRRGSPDSQNAIAAEWKNFDAIAAKAMLLASFGESQQSHGLRLIRGRK